MRIVCNLDFTFRKEMKKLLIFILFLPFGLQAQVYEFNTQTLGQWNGAGEAYSDVWGYSANGREYAILGSARYIYFFDVTNPAAIQLVEKFGPYTSTSWREFKTYSHYAYAVTDGPDAGGLRIFDLQYLPDTVIQVRQTTAFFTKCHMPFIDEANGRLYCAGTNTRNNGIIVLDLSARPDSPSLVINQALPRGYVHDVYVKNNVMYASHIYSGYLSQYNCTGNSCSGELSAFQTGGYNHSSWMNADQSLLINAIETAGHPLWLFPIEAGGQIGTENYKQFKSATLKDQYPDLPVGEGSIGHNPYIVGSRAYISYYTDGVQVYDISDPGQVRRIAYFDTDRGYTSYSPVFRGCWGTYPFFPSGNILASDIQSGLWIFKTTACAASQPPTVTLSTPASSYPGGSSFKITANALDADGSIAKVEFYESGALLSTDTEAPFEYMVAQAEGTAYQFTAKAFDDCGISTVSSGLSIGILPSCSDGIKNGDEEGVDCGGTYCDPCLPACNASFNLSLGKQVSQSSNFNASNSYPPSFVNDGNLSNFNHTGLELQPWCQIDLGASYQVSEIEIVNRKDCCGDRLKRFRVFVSEEPVQSFQSNDYIFEFNNSKVLSNGEVINIQNINKAGRYVKVWMDNTNFVNNYLHLTEIKVMGCCLNSNTPTVDFEPAPSTYIQGENITVTAVAEDLGGTVSKVEFYNGMVLLGTDFTPPYSHTIIKAMSDMYQLTAKAYDNCDGATVTEPWIIKTSAECDDGFQNGAETGVDCGGVCKPCLLTCTSPVNISQGKTASQSSNFNSSNSYPASQSIDGNIASSSFNHTGAEVQPWWQVDLGQVFSVSTIEIHNRKGCSACSGRIKKFRVFISNAAVGSYSSESYVFQYDNPAGMVDGEVISIPNLSASGRYVRIWVDNTGYANNYLHLAEVRVLGCCTSTDANALVLSSNASEYIQGSSFAVDATMEGDPSQFSRVEFYNNGSLLSTDLSFPFSHLVSPASAGSYLFHAKAIGTCSEINSNFLNITTTKNCNDGYKNGVETGIDCGGDCTPCSQTCLSTVNLAQGMTASQSSNFNSSNSYPASRAVDGSIASASFNHTNAELQPWWEVDLGASKWVTDLEIVHRTGCSACAGRVKKFKIFLTETRVSGFGASEGMIYLYDNPVGLANGAVITIPGLSASGRYLRIWADNGNAANYLHFAEVKVMGCTPIAALVNEPAIPDPQKNNDLARIRIYPNPVDDFINLQFDFSSAPGTLFQIIDINGKLLQTGILGDPKIDLRPFPAGSYFLRILTREKTYPFKVIKL